MTDLHSRRAFLRSAIAAGAAWATADLVQVEAALEWAAQQASAGPASTFSVLTASQAEVLDALASRIIPAVDGRPGAHEAGVVHFIDKALATFNAPRKIAYEDGVRDLNERAARKAKAGTSFAALPAAQQDEIIRDIEKTPFFLAARFDTIVGTFALPSWGGNRGYVGWHLIGLEHQPRFQAPFGYYDAEANKRAANARPAVPVEGRS